MTVRHHSAAAVNHRTAIMLLVMIMIAAGASTPSAEPDALMNRAAPITADAEAVRPQPTIDAAEWKIPHLQHGERLAGVRDNLRSARTLDTIAFGDSLLDLTRNYLKTVPSALNFSISGSWSHHMAQMAGDVHRQLEESGRHGEVRFVIIGSLGGNPLLMHQPVDVVIRHSLAALDDIRRRYPKVRLIVYGIPPTVYIEVNVNAIPFEAELYRWVVADRDAVFLPLQRRFADSRRLFPKMKMTYDGIHFSRRGILVFDELLMKAKTAPAGSIVD